jgi:hypothetical protein
VECDVATTEAPGRRGLIWPQRASQPQSLSWRSIWESWLVTCPLEQRPLAQMIVTKSGHLAQTTEGGLMLCLKLETGRTRCAARPYRPAKGRSNYHWDAHARRAFASQRGRAPIFETRLLRERDPHAAAVAAIALRPVRRHAERTVPGNIRIRDGCEGGRRSGAGQHGGYRLHNTRQLLRLLVGWRRLVPHTIPDRPDCSLVESHKVGIAVAAFCLVFGPFL